MKIYVYFDPKPHKSVFKFLQINSFNEFGTCGSNINNNLLIPVQLKPC